MALSVSNKRKAVVVDYSEDQDQLQGDSVTGSAKNIDTGDVGSRQEQNNDGEFVFFYPKDFTGSDEVTLTGSDGGEITGTITV